MNRTIGLGKAPVGIAGFPALLMDASLINRSDLSLAEQHAARERMPLVDALVALKLVREEDSYAKLAEAGGFELADLEHTVSSELDALATRLRPEQAAVENVDQGDGPKSDAVVMDLCNQLIGRAVEVGASDVHIECMRVIDSHGAIQSLDRLGYDDNTLARLERVLARPDGLVLVTGPTGSGKSTTLYAALGHLCTGRTNIVSVEDPVERTVPGITQIPVNMRVGDTFPAVLRSLLRQNPNVIMVGEVRDAEVAKIVGEAAHTGRFVLASMQTVDTATAVTRLTNLGLEPFKLVECLSAVLAQRLLRSLCPHCKKSSSASQTPQPDAEPHVVVGPASAGPGCVHCRHTSYAGRVPIVELLTSSVELRDAIMRGATAHDIRVAMRTAGTPNMRDHALRLVAAGVTSIEEVNRVLAEDVEGTPVTTRTRPRVLIADDEPITRMLVKLLLEREKFDVVEAANGKIAVEMATRDRPDLMIVDLNMPEMDGYETIGWLRRDITMTTLPIMVLTSEEGPGVERRVLELGADDYIIKPFDPAVLLSRVNGVFRRLKVMAA